jgi:hypothetical protein
MESALVTSKGFVPGDASQIPFLRAEKIDVTYMYVV